MQAKYRRGNRWYTLEGHRAMAVTQEGPEHSSNPVFPHPSPVPFTSKPSASTFMSIF